MKFALLRWLVLSLLLIGSIANASTSFGKAKDLLDKKQPIAAIRLLHPAISSNQATPGEWQLAAIAYWNAYGGDLLAYALRAATIANRLAPNSETRQLLSWLQQKVPNRIEGIPAIALFRVLNDAVLQVPVWILLLLGAIGSAVVGIKILLVRIEPVGFLAKLNSKSVFVLGCSLLILSLALTSWQHHLIKKPIAFVTQNGVTVLQQPDLGAKEVTTLSIGTEVKPLNLFSRWQEIQLPDGRKGWVQGVTLLHIVL